jgi:hypothetical protein
MSKIKSVFGGYADRLQIMVDSSLDKFKPTWFASRFPFGIPSTSLNFQTIIGRSRIEAAASIIARGSQAPLRVRATLEKLSGEVPAIAEKFAMKESDYRDFLTLQALSIDDNVKKQQLLDLMFGDVMKAGDAAMKRLDYMVLEALYSGQITLTTTNNPDGVVSDAIDLLMPSGNKTDAAINWATSASATPITDITTVVEYQSGRGVMLANILMSRGAWVKFYKTTEVKDSVFNWMGLKNNKGTPTLDVVNEFMIAHRLPTIEIVDVPIGIEKDGVITTVRPFGDDAVTFIPAGPLGKIHNAVAIEEIRPVESVAYAKYNNALLSKWAENEPFNEWTKVELNAFPALEAIDQCHILDITATP